MKKFTFVYNSVWYDKDVEHKDIVVDKVEGYDLKDAAYRHWQMTLDEGIKVDDIIFFEGDLPYKVLDDVRNAA